MKSNGAPLCILGPGSQSFPGLVFTSLHTLLQRPLPTASSSSVTKSSSPSPSLSSSLCRGMADLLLCASAAAWSWLPAPSSALAAVWPHVLLLSPTKGQTQKRCSCPALAEGWSFSRCLSIAMKTQGCKKQPDRCKHTFRLKQEAANGLSGGIPPAGINSQYYESAPSRPQWKGSGWILHKTCEPVLDISVRLCL